MYSETEPSTDTDRVSTRRLALEASVVFLVAALVFLVGLKAKGLLVWDESLYCGTTSDMLRHSIALYPTERGEFFSWYGKPPLINWLQMLSTKFLGWSVFTLRLPTALAAASALSLLWLSGRLLGNRWLAATAVCILMVSRHFLSTGQQMWIEDLVAPLFAAGLLAYSQANANRRTQYIWVGVAGLFFGSAILAKQAFALFAPCAVTLLELYTRRPRWFLRLVVCGLVTVGAAGWWFVATYITVGDIALDSWYGYHIAERFSHAIEGHVRKPDAFGKSLNLHLGVPWVLGVAGWLVLYKDLKAGAAKRLHLSWSFLFALQYIVVGILLPTFLHWYQVILLPPLALGYAHLAVKLAARQYPWWVRFLLPAIALIAATSSARLDTIVVAAVLGLIVLGYHHIDAMQKWLTPKLTPWSLVAVAAVLGIIVTNPTRRRDPRAKIATALNDAADVTVLAADPEYRVWRCYLPNAEVPEGEKSCADVSKLVAHASNIIVEGELRACVPEIFEMIEQARDISLLRRRDS